MKFKPIRKNSGVVLELGPLESRLPADPREQVATPRPVFQLKKILVPVDFSDCSKKALQYALPFARQFEAELALVHVVQAYVAVPEMVPEVAAGGLNGIKTPVFCDVVAGPWIWAKVAGDRRLVKLML